MNNNTELKQNLIKNVTSVCLKYSDVSKEYVEEKLNLTNFDTILKWNFQEVYNYQARGFFLYNNKFFHKKLFETRGLLIYSCPNVRGSISENKRTTLANENFYHDIWLLEDMTFATTFSHTINFILNDERNTTQYSMLTDLFIGDFEVETFINAINMLCDELFLEKFNGEVF